MAISAPSTADAGTDDDDSVAGLVMAARAGSSRAYDELYRRHVAMVAHLARTRASRDPAVVNDVVQEVFTRGLERLDQLRDPQRFGAWIRAITNNVIVDHHRAAARSRRLDVDDAERIEATTTTPQAQAEGVELAGALREAMAALSPRDATAVVLVATLGLRPAELGEVLDLSPGAAKVALHRARKRLRAALDAAGATSPASAPEDEGQRSGTGPVG
jgi:RNA polymerase sigma factor (sigma-70 family)